MQKYPELFRSASFLISLVTASREFVSSTEVGHKEHFMTLPIPKSSFNQRFLLSSGNKTLSQRAAEGWSLQAGACP